VYISSFQVDKFSLLELKFEALHEDPVLVGLRRDGRIGLDGGQVLSEVDPVVHFNHHFVNGRAAPTDSVSIFGHFDTFLDLLIGKIDMVWLLVELSLVPWLITSSTAALFHLIINRNRQMFNFLKIWSLHGAINLISVKG
jgi:hypothetical protein